MRLQISALALTSICLANELNVTQSSELQDRELSVDIVDQIDYWKWKAEIENSHDAAWFILFYAESCPYSQKVSPEFYDAAEKCAAAGRNIKFGAVQADVERFLTWHYDIIFKPSVLTLNFQVAGDTGRKDVHIGKESISDFLNEVC